MISPIISTEIKWDHDVVLIRKRTRQLSKLLGFGLQDQTRLSTAVSEVARNAFRYAGGGKATFSVEMTLPQALLVTIQDKGAGIENLQTILDGRYKSQTGMGIGLIGSKKLVDNFEIVTGPTGTTVHIKKELPKFVAPVDPKKLSAIANELAQKTPDDPFEEIQLQNQELLSALTELRTKQAELAQLNLELEDTNRGVVALYAELDEKADHLQRANEIKTRFLSNMTHEFRTPLNSILSLSALLLDRTDGSLTHEQEKQVTYIKKSASDLSELVNDLLDLAKVEAGKIEVRPVEFEVKDLFGALRGMLKPLLASNSSINLIFEDGDDLPKLKTDEGKVSQILRNFISNALKFTENGMVRVTATMTSKTEITFSVEDTGIGIAESDLARVFEDFVQVDSEVQRRVKGTGLGLPLSKRLSELLGGYIGVKSEMGKGSVFSATIPVKFSVDEDRHFISRLSQHLDPDKKTVLAVEDNEESILIYERYLSDSGYQLVAAASVAEAKTLLRSVHAEAIIMDILLEAENTWSLIADLKNDLKTRLVPIIVVSLVDNEKKVRDVGADAFAVKPTNKKWLLETLDDLTSLKNKEIILLIDDGDISRYVLKNILSDAGCRILEAKSGDEGLDMARDLKPKVIFLDLVMPKLTGFDVLRRLKESEITSQIPVIINTSKILTAHERQSLEQNAVAILSKQTDSPRMARQAINSAFERCGIGIKLEEAKDASS